MVTITESEKNVIRSEYPNKQLRKSSGRKRKGGKTYYVYNDDYESLKILSKLRGKTISEIADKID